MNMHLHQNVQLSLIKGQQVSLDDDYACTIVCEHGCLWITEEGSIKDFFLEDNESLAIDHFGTTVFTAMSETEVTLRMPTRTPTTPVEKIGPGWHFLQGRQQPGRAQACDYAFERG